MHSRGDAFRRAAVEYSLAGDCEGGRCDSLELADQRVATPNMCSDGKRRHIDEMYFGFLAIGTEGVEVISDADAGLGGPPNNEIQPGPWKHGILYRHKVTVVYTLSSAGRVLVPYRPIKTT